MKAPAFILTLALLILAGVGSPKGQETENKVYNDRWLAQDKVSHLALSAALVGFSYHLLRYEQQKQRAFSRNLAVGLSLGWGLAKETRDASSPNNHFCYKDLTANLLGAGLGIIIFITN
ncbi:hypothetical protein HY768_03700 [candidate division TA06 bacterium]|uniref:Uncharacterized protein n=1 Tax=candidate division TA06 bacterium TaxID=2250710 RepID=A0A933I7Z8_UNCT6|nr:hypothetical protein [candidate division TA06 bacterium]